MLNSLRYRLLAWILAFVLLVILLIIPANIIHDRKEKKISQVVLSVDALYITFLKDSKAINDFLFAEPVNDNFFITGESQYIESHMRLSDQIKLKLAGLEDVRQIRRFEISQELSLLSRNYQLYNQLFDSLVYLVYKRGYKDYGLEGELYTYGMLLEKAPELPQSAIDGLRRNESAYLTENESEAGVQFKDLVSDLKLSIEYDQRLTENRKVQLLDLVTSYQNAFERLIRLDQQTGIRKNIALKAELNELSGKIELSMQSIVEKSTAMQKSLISRLNMMYLAVLLLIITCVTYFSFILSKYVVAHLEALTNYISRLSSDPAKVVPDIELHNPTREILQIYHEFRNLVR